MRFYTRSKKVFGEVERLVEVCRDVGGITPDEVYTCDSEVAAQELCHALNLLTEDQWRRISESLYGRNAA